MNSIRLRAARKAAIGIAFAWIACIAPLAFAETLAYWNPTGTLNTSSPLPPTTVSANLSSAGNLSGGPGLTGGSWANAYALDNWPTGALDTNDYLAFSTTGNNIAYSTVVFSLYNNYDGSGSWEIRSSIDGYASALDSGTFSGIFAGGELITANVGALGTYSGTVQFRLYTFNNSGATNPLQRGIRGTGGGGQGLSVNGSAASPSSSTTTTTLSANPTQAALGQSIQFVATVSASVTVTDAIAAASANASPVVGPGKRGSAIAATPSGSVTFFDGASALGSAPLSGVTATFASASLAVGTHSITAQYSGDASYDPSTSAAVSVNITAPPTNAPSVAAPMLAPGTLLALVAALGASALFGMRGHRSGKRREDF